MIDRKRTQEELEQELKNDRIEEKEDKYRLNKIFVQKVMKAIEDERKRRMKTYPCYTQAYVAKKSGISLSTYKSYLLGNNANLCLATFRDMVKILNINPDDILKSVS